jgi:hypothetical protein
LPDGGIPRANDIIPSENNDGGGVIGVVSLFPEFGVGDGVEIDPDRLENTPKSFFEKVFFFNTGDVRAGFVLALSLVVSVVLLVILSLRVFGRISI